METANIIQGSDAWHQARLGKVTASRVADVIAKTKTGWGASRKNYMAELVVERLTGEPTDIFNGFTPRAVQWGTDTEPQARAAYEFTTDNAVTEIGFIDHPVIAMSGASPDGLVADSGLVEIKCPNTATHIDTLLNGTMSDKYIVQMQWQMACGGQEWCDWVSFDPRLPENLRLFVQRVDRDEDRIRELEMAVTTFLSELDETIAALEKVAA